MPAVDLAATFQALLATAIAQSARWPQYKNHFAEYRLVRIKRDVKIKMGLAFARGEYAIGIERSPTHPLYDRLGRHVTVWSKRNTIDTSVCAEDVEWLS